MTIGLFAVLLMGAMPSVSYGEALESAVIKTIQNHPSIDVARADVDAAKQKRIEEFSNYFPELTVSGTGGRIFGDNSTSRGTVTTRGSAYSDYFEGSVTAKQMLFDGFETSYRVNAAKAKKKSARINILDVQENLALKAAQAYVELTRARTGLAMLRAQEGKIQDYLNRIESMVNEGAADEAEYQQARDVRVILDGFVLDYEGQVLLAEATYIELTGALPSTDLNMPVPRMDQMIPNVDGAVAYAKANHPMIEAAKLTTKSARHEIDAERAVMLPDVNSELSYLKTDKLEELGGEVKDAKALVRLNWNYEVGGAQQARIAQKRVRHKESLARIQELERQVEFSIRQAYSEYKTAQAQLENQQQRLELNAKLFETYEIQFEGARINLLQLMQSDNQFFTTKLERMNAQARMVSAGYGVLASLSRLQQSLNLKLSMNAQN